MWDDRSTLERRLALRIGLAAAGAAVAFGSLAWLAALGRHPAWSVGLVLVIVLATAGILYTALVRRARRLERVTLHLLDANLEILNLLGGNATWKESDRIAHSYRATTYAACLAEVVGLDTAEMRALIQGGLFHDGGKSPVRAAALLQPGRPGGGPQGLRDAEAPITARIFALVDVFDALTSRRPYKEPLSFDDAMLLLEKGRGSRFDSKLLDKFRPIARELHVEFGGAEQQRPRQELDRVTRQYFQCSLDELIAATPHRDRPTDIGSPALTGR